MKQICTTLKKIRESEPCEEGWKKLLKHLNKKKADNKPLPLSVILESNSLHDALWTLRSVPEYNNLWRKYAVWCARQVQHLITDQRSLDALDVAWRHSEGEATDGELAAAWNAARDAAGAVAGAAAWNAARDAAGAVAGAAAGNAARAAARAAAWNAAWAVAWAAAWNAARAAAWDAAWDAARAAAWDAAWDAQTEKFSQIIEAGEWVE